jgi:1,4-dihydroxy-2-naphthoate octaprenyltransferase
MVFRGDSPNGTSIFGMLTATGGVEKQNAEQGVAIQPAIIPDIGMFIGLLGIVFANPVILVIVICIIAVIMYVGWWKRRSKPPRP